jgi:CRISPR-associated protein Cmr6
MKYPLPQKPVAALGKIGGKPTNPGLLFDRFAPDWGGAPTKEEKSEWKKAGLTTVRDHATDKDLVTACKARWEKVAKTANATPFLMRTDWRFIAGLGRKGSFEVGFTFHRHGFAMLPGSSVKGIARAWGLLDIANHLRVEDFKEGDLNELDEALRKDEVKGFLSAFEKFAGWQDAQPIAETFRTIFGTTGAAGGAVFFDGMPTQTPKLELDVMTPHFVKYYSGPEYPADTQDPQPVPFLTVAKDQEFVFAVGWRGSRDNPLRGQAEGWLKSGLENLGAGAKTSAGYGYFVDIRRSS